jgi:hypothetical protein
LNTKKIDAIRKNIDFKDADQVIGIFKLGEEEIGRKKNWSFCMKKTM